ncbi:MAG: crossover junction endodeoxyribonuclease RuvC [Puniceicoccales bacterium]|nr:crossover junction endodeoxyribonuclease RuvC [Puniceicoccales bacterium]
MAKKSTRQLWTDALNGGSLKKQKSTDYQCSRGCSGIILGIDPSLRGTGIAILESYEKRFKFIFSKRLSLEPRFSFYRCLGEIFGEIDEIVVKYQPSYAAVERTIFVQNYKIAQTLGSVRGAVLAALARREIEVCEYPPLRIKQAITGVGRASKEQVMGTVKNILNIEHEISSDESDALAAACCHAWTFVPE